MIWKKGLLFLISEIERIVTRVGRRINPKYEVDITREFHNLYVNRDEQSANWLGVYAKKCPLDLWIYQEVMFELRPDLIIECGTCAGGSAYFMASILDIINHGRIITIDIDDYHLKPQHKRIEYLQGSSTSPEITQVVRKKVKEYEDKVIMVVLDSDHKMAHVLQEMQFYSELISLGSYLIVEDTNLNGHPAVPFFGPGPMEAVDEFLKHNNNFIIDKNREKFLLTSNPSGYLKRIK